MAVSGKFEVEPVMPGSLVRIGNDLPVLIADDGKTPFEHFMK